MSDQDRRLRERIDAFRRSTAPFTIHCAKCRAPLKELSLGDLVAAENIRPTAEEVPDSWDGNPFECYYLTIESKCPHCRHASIRLTMLPPLEIVSIEGTFDIPGIHRIEAGMKTLSGMVRNNNQEHHQSADIVIALYDFGAEQIGTTVAKVRELPPSTETPWEAEITNDAATAFAIIDVKSY